jgi:hypothetical protein
MVKNKDIIFYRNRYHQLHFRQIFILYAAEGGIKLNLVCFRSLLDRMTPP